MNDLEINITDNEEEYLFKIKSKFNPLIISLRYPLQICVTMLILIFMVPEVISLITWLTGIEGFIATILSLTIVFGLSLIGPLILTFGKYHIDKYIFYPDRVEFNTGIILREKAIVYYHSIKQFKKKPNIVQRYLKLSNLKLVEQKQAGPIKMKKRTYIIHDIKDSDAKKILKEVSTIIKSYQNN